MPRKKKAPLPLSLSPDEIPKNVRDRTAEKLGIISGTDIFSMRLTPEQEAQARLEDDLPAPRQAPFKTITPLANGVVKKERTEVPAIIKQQAWELAQARKKGVEEPTMAMSKTAEVQQALGAEMLKGVKEAGKEMVKGGGGPTLSVDGAFISPETVDALQTMVREYQTVGVQIRRKNHLTQTFASLRAIPEVAPSLLVSPGVDELVRDWSGGGEYEINIVAPGMKPLKLYRTIEGDPLPAKPDRGTQQSPAGSAPGLVQANQMPPQAFVPPTSGMPAGITWQQVPGQPWNWKATPSQTQPMDPMMMMLAMMLERQSPRGGDSDERLREMERRMTEEKRDLERRLEEEKRERAEEQRRREDERSRELQNSRIDQLAQLIQQQNAAAQQAQLAAREDTKWKTLEALGPMIAPVITTMLTRGDSQMQVFTKVLETQQGASQQNIDVLKTLLDRPGPEDRMAKMMGVVSDMMTAQVSSTSSLLQSGLLQQGGESPVVQIISQILGTVGEVGKVMLAAKMGMGMDMDDDDDSPSMPALPAPAPAPAPLVAQQAAPAALPSDPAEHLAGLEEHIIEEGTEASEAPEAEEPGVDDEDAVEIDLMNDTAFAKIFELIVTGGDVKEIAVRMWRHAGSGDEKKGHPLAVQWVKLPVEVGQHVLTQIKGMPDARIREVTNGLVELNAYIRNGGDPENYAKGMKPKRGRPAKLSPVPDAPVEKVIEASSPSSPSSPTPSTVQSSDMTSITSE